ncbi:MAG: hypothetical protein JW764_09315 [Chlorobiaceae bacterium]|nr:hypothetical protein [Chlorobiaceae bacterium]
MPLKKVYRHLFLHGAPPGIRGQTARRLLASKPRHLNAKDKKIRCNGTKL